jgi:hypothetical protein
MAVDKCEASWLTRQKAGVDKWYRLVFLTAMTLVFSPVAAQVSLSLSSIASTVPHSSEEEAGVPIVTYIT